MQGQEDIVVAKFLQASDINTIRLKRLYKDGVLGFKVYVGANIPYKDIDGFCIGAKNRRKRSREASAAIANAVAEAKPC